MASAVWDDIILTRCNAVLAEVKDSVSSDSFMDCRNAQLSFTKLFQADVLEKAVVSSPKVLHYRLCVKQLPRNSLSKWQEAKASSSSFHRGKGR